MTKKGYPGLVLVPPSDRTLGRRRLIRWSLFGMAIIWGLFIISLWGPPSNKSDCQTLETQGSPTTNQEDCHPVSASPLPSQLRTQELRPATESAATMGAADGQSPLVSPSGSPSPDSPKPTNEQTIDHPLSTNSPAAQNNGIDHTRAALPENTLASNQSPTQPTKPNAIAEHKAMTQTGTGSPPHPPVPSIPSAPTASDRKAAAHPGNGSVSPPASPQHQPAKATSTSADHKHVVQAPKEPATPSIPNQPTKSMTSTTDHKHTGQSESGPAPHQASTKPITPSSQTASDRKPAAQPGNGAGQPQTPSQPPKSIHTSIEYKPTAQSLNGSAPRQTSLQPINPTHPSPDHPVVAQLGNSSSTASPPTGNPTSRAGQSSNGDPLNQSLSSSTHQDTRLAEEGDAFAQYRLGRFYAQQGGRQTPEAVKWYKKAASGLRHLAETGNGQAMYVLGVMYVYGRGVKKDPDQARHWLSQAVSHKITAARSLLANLEKDDSAGPHAR